ncbi:probable E3 ubiquitin-protein ligase DTX2 isoform X3 [Penaeus chinensis]|uniref:probable E3 ubiquitin-protein ligase DTX2 isoform X3 n=1 Tax=Penaeus chinensis TaxID=139456 RepID=UPI001FB62F4D|nr:probable E3 ubiquitin-protein ligase DTX2 isoform X3 [Penaeus chinensis]
MVFCEGQHTREGNAEQYEDPEKWALCSWKRRALVPRRRGKAEGMGSAKPPSCAPDINVCCGGDEGVVKLTKCGHSLHKLCARMMAESKQHFIPCPMCKTVHGVRLGNQPDGVMEIMTVNDDLPGFDCGTIIITYRFSGGIQGREHPIPGHPYRAHAFPRRAFLPDNERGNKILQLLEVAWQRRLIFTVGTSITSGQENVITWNEIHHKTEWENYHGHGYPDPAYLDNVTMELELQGVTEADLESNGNRNLE